MENKATSKMDIHFTIICQGNKVNEDIYRPEVVEYTTLYALTPVKFHHILYYSRFGS